MDGTATTKTLGIVAWAPFRGPPVGPDSDKRVTYTASASTCELDYIRIYFCAEEVNGIQKYKNVIRIRFGFEKCPSSYKATSSKKYGYAECKADKRK